MRVAVIGAGPSGLVTLKYLKTAHQFFDVGPIEVLLFELEAAVGGTFAHRAYEDAELVSSKQLTTFSDFRPRKEDPDFLSAERYVEYLNQYCDHYDLWPFINLSTTVLSIRRGPGNSGGHVVHYRGKDGKNRTWECNAVAVCSGLHMTPNFPDVPGIEMVPFVTHAAQFKARQEFGLDKTVVVLGVGETGVDMAHLAVTSATKRVILCHRDGFLCAPKRTPLVTFRFLGERSGSGVQNLPVDVSQATLFESMYVHPLLRDTLFLWNYYDVLIKTALWIATGSHHGYDQWVAGVGLQRYHASMVFFSKGAAKANPYISAPYRPQNPGWIQRIRSSIIQCDRVPIVPNRTIDIAPWPTHIDSEGRICFRDNGRPEYARMKDEIIVPDIIIFATGYNQTFPYLDTEPTSSGGYPHAADADVRMIWRACDPTIGFIGFLRPAFGAIPALSEMQAQLWIMNLVAPDRLSRPLQQKDEYHYRLHPPPGARITYGVDHESYAYQLALDMGSAASFTDIVKAGWKASQRNGLWWKLPVIWAAGAQFNAKFRLDGPYRWDGAVQVLGVELWETISRRRGLLGTFTLAVIPIVLLGSINLGLCLYSIVPIAAESIAQLLIGLFSCL